MPPDKNKLKDLAKKIKKASRLARLEHEKNHGKLRSKSWGELPSNKQERRSFKQNANKLLTEEE